VSSGRIVSVDTMTLVWGIRKDGTAQQTKRARWLFQALDDEESQIVIPSVSLSEYLTLVDSDKRSAVAQHMTERFIVAPFDVPSAVLAARLFNEERPKRKGGKPNARKILRADCLIVATAASYGATTFFSADKDCRSMANQVMTAKDLPDQPDNLFDY